LRRGHILRKRSRYRLWRSIGPPSDRCMECRLAAVPPPCKRLQLSTCRVGTGQCRNCMAFRPLRIRICHPHRFLRRTCPCKSRIWFPKAAWAHTRRSWSKYLFLHDIPCTNCRYTRFPPAPAWPRNRHWNCRFRQCREPLGQKAGTKPRRRSQGGKHPSRSTCPRLLCTSAGTKCCSRFLPAEAFASTHLQLSKSRSLADMDPTPNTCSRQGEAGTHMSRSRCKYRVHRALFPRHKVGQGQSACMPPLRRKRRYRRGHRGSCRPPPPWPAPRTTLLSRTCRRQHMAPRQPCTSPPRTPPRRTRRWRRTDRAVSGKP
jgi:hypothetical protein